ncbi:helix-turn-helix domain-containing protein [Pseudomonas sp. JS3066]|jgi:transcriptional regulator GlxA family with amidase domain|uniref:GlxA family transcriptional regulator n=1 Tax=unclassified Pseudomonas TaxID=196821 RepID=UPI000EAA53E0|nr:MULTISPECIES: helix-turn-helix domain-containing protein [unclassified Pseudomonas]AYF85780.1 helix-turn-helix domain-containing protein [Pseudomonas sp. DY-1]MDH4654970.1 helix-turn-helix domain-containing protein [Pseudomonas sp. BN606]MRK19461.1 helix-turn-helix domain-containing protein [Pseudomonas sp. JG-B]WVK91635.1 helix-turn-helix domain-containing protein [Pseudomonas sp. JS3066]
MRASFESVLKSKNLAHLDKARRSGLTTPVRRVSFILREHFSMMAFTGAVDALVTANLMSSTPVFEVQVVGGDSNLVVSDLGISISTDCVLSELDEKRQDILVVCGGFRVRLETEALLRTKLRSADAAGAVLGGLWNGAYFLAEAGLLDDHDCAFHPDCRAMMMELFPKVRVTSHSQVLDRRRISCAGANSSLGMMLEVVRHSAGDDLVSAVEEVLSCDKMKDVVDVSVVSIDFDPTLPETIKLALELMHSNIEDPIEIEEIARYVGISRRHLERLFRRYVKATPPRYYLELRLTRARQLLQHTNKSLIEIAVASGFVTLPHFQRCFRAMFDMAPGQFRKRNHFKV